MSKLNLDELTLDSIVEFKTRGQVRRSRIGDIIPEGTDEEEFLGTVAAWIMTGNAKIIDTRTNEEKMADKIAEELGAIKYAKDINQDHEDRLSYGQENLGTYKKVAFPAKSLIHAEELVDFISRNYNLSEDDIGYEKKGKNVQVVITNCPIKTYQSISKALTAKRATEAVSNTVEKTAKTAINAVDITLGSVGIPVAKTAIKTTAKLAKSLFGFGAKVAGIAIGETLKAGKECVEDIRTDVNIAEARGEVIEGVHSIKRTVNGRNSSFGGGTIIEE